METLRISAVVGLAVVMMIAGGASPAIGDGWRDYADGVSATVMGPPVSEDRAYEIVEQIFETLRDDLAASGFGEPDVRVYSDQDCGIHINVFNGFPRGELLDFYTIIIGGPVLSEIGGEASFAAKICHEFGHILGRDLQGNRIVFEGGRADNDMLAPEGEADYQALALLRRVIERHPELLQEPLIPEEHRRMQVARAYVSRVAPDAEQEEIDLLGRLIVAGWMTVSGDISPFTPDETVVQHTELYYPTPQARLDSMIAGLMGQPRPRSWCAFPE